MLSSDPKLPLIAGTRPLDPPAWITAFVARFYSLWRELTLEIQTVRGRARDGTYTPTLYKTTNVTAATAYECQYMRVGNTVTVSGRFAIDVTAAGADTILGISLPFPSAFTANEQLGGTAVRELAANQTACGYIRADTTNDRAYFSYYHALGAANYSWHFTFTYRVI